MTIPVSAGRRQRLWTPSSSRGKDAAKRRSGKPSERRDSRERSRSSWFPTTWQQLGAKDSFRQRGFRCTRGLCHKRYFEAGLLAPGAPGGCSPAGHAAKGQQPTRGSAPAQTKGGTPRGTTTSALFQLIGRHQRAGINWLLDPGIGLQGSCAMSPIIRQKRISRSCGRKGVVLCPLQYIPRLSLLASTQA